MRKDHALDKNHSLFFLGLNANAIIDKDGTRRWSGANKKFFLVWSRMHRFLVCLMGPRIEKSGQV